MVNMPDGTVTFLFTDVEGSTRKWEQDRLAMSEAIRDHDRLLQAVMDKHNGYVFKTIGDAFCVAFALATEALEAALDGQRALRDHQWNRIGPLLARMAIHTGDPECRDRDYFGPTLNRVARLLSTGHGGQVLLSGSTHALVHYALPDGVQLHDFGFHRLKDLQVPERIYQPLVDDLPSAFPSLKTLDELPNNLPLQLTEFIGREREIEKVGQLLDKHRLVTLQGIGGSGKTRLSLQVGAERLEKYKHGVWFISLAEVKKAELVPQKVARVLQIEEKPGSTYMQALIEKMKSQEMLLILDNCEHLHTPCDELAAELLKVCPQLTILATSRQALDVPGGIKFPITTMQLPEILEKYDEKAIRVLLQCESVQLFVGRARDIEPDFTLTPENAPAVARICWRIEGIPFAVVLAASALRSMSVQEIAAHDVFRLPQLRRKEHPRQISMKAMLDFSYKMLGKASKTLLRQMWVFTGGCNLTTAHALCASGREDWEVLEVLTDLIETSLLQKETRDGKTRYRASETLRSYLQHITLTKEERDALQDRHLDYFLEWAEAEEPKLRGAEQVETLKRLAADHDNLRSALQWAERGERQARLAGALWRFWMIRGYFSEGREWLRASLASVNLSDAVRAKALTGAGVLAMRQSDYEAASAYFEECLALSCRSKNVRYEAEALNNLGHIARDHGDSTLARARYEESLSLWQKTGDQWGMAAVLNSLGMIMRDLGAPEAAKAYYTKCLEIYEKMDDTTQAAIVLSNLGSLANDQKEFAESLRYYETSLKYFESVSHKWGVATALNNVADTYYALGDYCTAEMRCRSSLVLCDELGDYSGFAYPLETMAKIASMQSQFARSVTLYAIAAELRKSYQTPLPEALQHPINEEIASVHTKLDDTIFHVSWTKGQKMSLEEIVTYAVEESDAKYPEHFNLNKEITKL